MKQLKGLDIVLKNFSKFILNFKYSRIFINEILVLSVLFVFLAFLFFEISFLKLLIILLVIIALNLLVLNSIGYKRRKEINEIKSVIKSIRKNKIANEEDIVLSKYLKNLEGNIKGMFQRTQNDIVRMEKLAQARSDFLGYVSHELRTPIFTIQGYLETLLDGAIDDAKVNRIFIKKALHHSGNLNALLNDLIDISMIESGLMSLSFKSFNIYDFLKNIIDEINSTEKIEGVNLKLLEFDKDIKVFGDKERLKQVMNNLISNALKYTPKGTIELSLYNKKKDVVICIKDSGIGIKKEDQKRIFERFYRTERDRSSLVPGTGLGLAIVKHILEAHNSSISVKSELGVGSEFTFKLKKD